MASYGERTPPVTHNPTPVIEFADSIDVAQSPARVFAFVSDLDNLPKIQSDVVQSTVLDPGTVHVGTRFEEVVKVGPRRVTAECVVTGLSAAPRRPVGRTRSAPRRSSVRARP
jgi:hypothetical protein